MSNDSRWAAAATASGGREYAARFAALAAAGTDVHGEATLCAALVPPGSRVLDAGCGTGRVAIRLAELGYECVGVDSDSSMLDEARWTSAKVTWLLADLSHLADVAALDSSFDLVVAAGNVIPLVAPGTEATVIAALATRLRPNGVLVAGFGLDAAHLPLTDAPFGLREYDEWCAHAGLMLERRFATWGGEEFADGGYAVTIHSSKG